MGNILVGHLTIVENSTNIVVERFGQYSRILTPGIHYLSPLERFKCVNWSFQNCELGSAKSLNSYRIPINDQCYNPKSIECRTQNGVKVGVDIVLYFSIIDTRIAVYSVNNLFQAIENKILTTLYAAVRGIPVEEITPEKINQTMNIPELSQSLEHWGVSVNNLLIENISLPKEIDEATVMTIGNKHRATVELDKLEAERLRKTKMARINLDEQQTRLDLENSERENKRQQELTELKHQLETQRLKTESELAMKKEKVNAEIETMKSKNQTEIHLLIERREAELKLLEREHLLMEQHPNSRAYHEKKLLSEAWAQIASSNNSKVILAPLDTLELAARQPIGHSTVVSTALSE